MNPPDFAHDNIDSLDKLTDVDTDRNIYIQMVEVLFTKYDKMEIGKRLALCVIPEDPIGTLLLADLLWITGESQRAATVYDKWLSFLDGGDAVPFGRLCHYSQERVRSAIRSLYSDPALSKSPLGDYLAAAAAITMGDGAACLAALPDVAWLAERSNVLKGFAQYKIYQFHAALNSLQGLAPGIAQMEIFDASCPTARAIKEKCLSASQWMDQFSEQTRANERASKLQFFDTSVVQKLDLSAVDIFIKTCAKDEEWLRWCLKSIDRFASGFRRVVIVTDHGHDFDPDLRYPHALFHASLADKPPPFHFPAGYMMQQVVKLSWFEYTDAQAVVILDSDLILKQPFCPEDLMINGEPSWSFGPWYGAGVMWRPGSELIIGRPLEKSHMQEHPFLMTRSATVAFKAFVETRCGKTIEELYFDRDFAAPFSEFECFGGYLATVNGHGYHVGELPAAKGIVKQHWSWGGLTPDIEASIRHDLKPLDL